jgi:2-polyprenyl-3-methyl-5-hydroxy-6-metoxy-1,4-benzoquinol methylase
MDKAGKQYWDDSWASSTVPDAVNPLLVNLNNYVNLKFIGFFSEFFRDKDTKGLKLLEIGCARSSWLPYFAKEFGMNVYGLDYSEIGCNIARQVLEKHKINGEIICADFFSPPDWMMGKFDLILSFGVVEHFEDTTRCIESFTKLLKPGGYIITSIPNLVGILGRIQKIIGRSIFDIHVRLDREALRGAHQNAGLEPVSCEYFIFVNFSVLNMENLQNKVVRQIFMRLFSWASKIIWTIEKIFPALAPNKFTSPYIICVARKTIKQSDSINCSFRLE